MIALTGVQRPGWPQPFLPDAFSWCGHRLPSLYRTARMWRSKWIIR